MSGPIKIVIVGDSGTGKTSIVQTYCKPNTDIDTLTPTVGVDFSSKCIDVNNQEVKLTIWDTAGQERFRSLCASYYRGAHVVIVVYDVTDIESFSNVESWLEEAHTQAIRKGAVFVLVGNKTDLDEERAVSRDQGEFLAQTKHMIFVETSARTHHRIHEPIDLAVQRTLTYFCQPDSKDVISLDQHPVSISLFGCC